MLMQMHTNQHTHLVVQLVNLLLQVLWVQLDPHAARQLQLAQHAHNAAALIADRPHGLLVNQQWGGAAAPEPRAQLVIHLPACSVTFPGRRLREVVLPGSILGCTWVNQFQQHAMQLPVMYCHQWLPAASQRQDPAK